VAIGEESDSIREKLTRWRIALAMLHRPPLPLPSDPEWERYLEERSCWKLTHTLAGRGRIEYLWKDPKGRCVLCGQVLQAEGQSWQPWW
jgi:hypothetical protein